ncbi:hypothetical protein ACH49_21090 [Streptomyces leeuwenhoekii]|uniref:DNA-binding protein n=1 Tax=Streptomyces leeuwenhoekii TaxID=1437453 RepID=A0ABR5HUS1_STRLW|nr:DUF6397 family protein [Streptomyces leeuwenhoekii]KMS76138.1 hypothetical protein ACH49_21090 [Streptomyces leeuwenhoekii]
MSGKTTTYQDPAATERIGDARPTPAGRHTLITRSDAARELGLKSSELDIAVDLGRVRTVPDAAGGRHVPRTEIKRLRGEEGFPRSLRESVTTVGTTRGAALMGVAKARFTRLARLGLLAPVTFYVNRYRAVVWLYPADELRQFATDGRNAPLLKGPLPAEQRGRLDTGPDLRPRTWRGRQLGSMLRQADDPWARAAAVASLLDPVHLSRTVRDPYERSHLNRLRRQPPGHGLPGSPAARIAAGLATADDPQEIKWLQAELLRALAAAREQRPAPRPRPHPAARRPAREATGPRAASRPTASHPAPRQRPPGGPGAARTRRVLSWFRRRGS